MHSEAQNTECFSVGKTLRHEGLHAYFFHVSCHFVLEFAIFANEIGDALFERLEKSSLFTLHDSISAAHLFSVGRVGRTRRHREDVPRFESLSFCVRDEPPVHVGNFVNLVPVPGLIRANEGPLGVLHAKRAFALKLFVSMLHDERIVRHGFGVGAAQGELELLVVLQLFGRAPLEITVNRRVVSVHRLLQARGPIFVLVGHDAPENGPFERADDPVDGSRGVRVLFVLHDVQNVFLVQKLLERAREL